MRIALAVLLIFCLLSPVFGIPYKVDISLLKKANKNNIALEGFPWGKIDWEERAVIVEGMGKIPKSYESKAQAKLLARRAALIDAERNALLLLYQLNYPIPKNYTTVKIKGIVGGGYVVNESFDGRTYKIVLKIPLKELLEYSVEIQ
ncbi:MAG: hypothetical protein J7M13_01110 [Synergistetes bacterium]|nr:hypothetical protein [Synergistota bacterium]